MRIQFTSAILALLPIATCGPFKAMPSTPNLNILGMRAAEPANIVSLAPSQDQPFFQITRFDAFMPSAAAMRAAQDNPAMGFSRVMFDVRLMHPDEKKRWTMRCYVHTAGTLCDPNAWRDCVRIEGPVGKGEKLRFRLGENVSSVDIRREWVYNGVTLRIGASEPATWIKKANDADTQGNMTVSAMGTWYKKADAWVFPWKQAVA